MAQQTGTDGEFNTVDAAPRSCGGNNAVDVGAAGRQPVIEAAPDHIDPPASTLVVRRGRRGRRRPLADHKQQYQHERMHIWTERERRKKMKEMFTNLHALLPHLPAKTDKSSIVDEAVNYIETLKYNIQLLKQKVGRKAAVDSSETGREAILGDRHKVYGGGSATAAELVSAHGVSSMVVPETSPSMAACFRTWSSPNVVLSVAGINGHLSICGAKSPGVLSSIFQALEDHNLEVVTTQWCSDGLRFICVIHVVTRGGPDPCLDEAAVEDLYKSAAGEIIQRVSP